MDEVVKATSRSVYLAFAMRMQAQMSVHNTVEKGVRQKIVRAFNGIHFNFGIMSIASQRMEG